MEMESTENKETKPRERSKQMNGLEEQFLTVVYIHHACLELEYGNLTCPILDPSKICKMESDFLRKVTMMKDLLS
jgi:hypothetical protein